MSITERWIALAAACLVPITLAGQAPEFPHGDFEDDCSLCHAAEAWTPVRISDEFDHSKRGFVLDGNHASTACRACHATLDFAVVETRCSGCHLDPHRGELGLDCADCHSPRSFIDRSEMVRGHLGTRLPLDGAHRTIDCEACHLPSSPGRMQFVHLEASCEACHLAEYLATVDPDHQAAGFPQTCDRCHSTRAWEPAGFDHSVLAAGAPCAGCHLDDYLATNDPDHQAAGFSQQCDDCHSTVAWQPATFDHDRLFPIFSGKHDGEWSACTDCHVNPASFAVFSCLDCHEHDNPADVADHHEDVGGYVYESQACYACHPTGDS